MSMIHVRYWLSRLTWFGAFLAVSVALITFQPKQTHFFSGRWPVQTSELNDLGLLGTWLAGLWLGIFGWACWLYPLWMLYEALLDFSDSSRNNRAIIRFFWVTLAVFWLSLSPWFQYGPLKSVHLSSWVLPSIFLWIGPIGFWIGWTLGLLFLLSFAVADFNGRPIIFSEKFVKGLKESYIRLKHTLDLVGNQAWNSEMITETNIEKSRDSSETENLLLVKNKSREIKRNLPDFLEDSTVNPERQVVTVTKQSSWQRPNLEIWADGEKKPSISESLSEINQKKQALVEKLQTFNIKGEITKITQGPALVLFEYKPDAGVKLSRISELRDDLQLALKSVSVRILAPIPGQDVVGFEIAKSHRDIVYLTDLLQVYESWSNRQKLGFVLGRKVTGEPAFEDLQRLPHMLIAGTTGSGKSQFILSMLATFIQQHTPDTLRLVLVDPKQVEFGLFENIPHLAAPVAKTPQEALKILKQTVAEMERRYQAMRILKVRSIEEFNLKIRQVDDGVLNAIKAQGVTPFPMPYLVVVVDEFADLMTLDRGECETLIIRLAQKARACGIHLVLALQSPRREFLTGAIKSNIPARLAFKTANALESRLILDDLGAQNLLGQGDFLMKSSYFPYIQRFHGPYVSELELNRLIQFWESQPKAQPIFDFEARSDDTKEKNFIDYEIETEILDWIQTQDYISASLLQRKFGMGYPRASRIVDQLAQIGLIVKDPKNRVWKVQSNQEDKVHANYSEKPN